MKFSRNNGTKHKRHNIKHSIIALLLVIGMIPIASLIGFSSDDAKEEKLDVDASFTTSTKLGSSLGLSGTVISTVEELKALATLVNAGTEHAGETYSLGADLNVAELGEWTPIGSQANPFKGYFNGNGFTIYGIGMDPYTTLFGYVKDATIRDLTVKTTKISKDSDPYEGLFNFADNSTITNVNVVLTPISASSFTRAYSTVTEDPSWFTGIGAGTYTIDSAGQFLALQTIVNSGNADSGSTPYDFDGQTIHITGNLAMSGVSKWVGIGTEASPFRGTVEVSSGVKITGFTMNTSDFSDTRGLFGYTAMGAELSGFHMTGTKISGDRNVGALVGFATDTIISNCSVSGDITGSTNVGGLVGTFAFDDLGADTWELFDPSYTPGVDDPVNIYTSITGKISDSYTTANVTGTQNVGGLIGQITYLDAYPVMAIDTVVVNNCFTTGRISGAYMVGGIVGFADHNNKMLMTGGTVLPLAFPTDYSIQNSASSSRIDGISYVGGIVGKGERVFQSSQYEGGTRGGGAPLVAYSYFSGELHGIEAISGLIGSLTGAYNSYVSGYVVSPNAATSNEVWPVSAGQTVLNPSLQSAKVWADPNTVYNTSNPLNADTTSGLTTGYKKVTAGATHFLNENPTYFDVATSASIPNFAPATLSYSRPGAPDQTSGVNIPTAGNFPKLDSFTGMSNPAFGHFSELSTNYLTKSLPSKMYRSSDGYAATIAGGTAIELPSIGGAVWTINGGNSLIFEDVSLEDGVNSIEIKGNKLAIAHPVNEAITFNVSVMIPSVDGFQMNYVVTLSDEVVRSTYGEFPKNISTDLTEAKASTNYMTSAEYMHFISFPQTITGSGTATLTIYGDSDFGTVLSTDAVTYSIVDQKVLKLQWDPTKIEFGKSYSFTLASGSVKEVESGNDFAGTYYFRTQKNEAPKLIFDPTNALAGLPNSEISADGQTQIVYLTETSRLDSGIYNGVLCENESYIDITTKIPDTATLQAVTQDKTMAGEGDYTGTPLASINITNFYKVPGEYTVKYVVEDEEEAGLYSNTLTRIYRIGGPVKVTQNGAPLQMFGAEFDSEEVVDIYLATRDKGLSLQDAVKAAITQKYVTATSNEQLAAYFVNYEKKLESLPFNFDVSGVDEGIYKEGFTSALSFTVGNEKFMYLLIMRGLAPNREIRLDNTVYVVENTFTSAGAKRHFNPTVIRKSDGKVMNESITYNLKDIEQKKYGIPQELTMTLNNKGKDLEIPGVDLTVSAKVTVVINQVNKYKHPEDIDDEAAEFWGNTLSKIEKAEPGRVFNLDMSYWSAQETPSDFFRILNKREDVTVNFKLPSGIVLTVNSEDVNTDPIPGHLKYMMGVEPMYNLYINRDASGAATQQIYAPQIIDLPGKMTLTVDLDESLPKEGLSIYKVNEISGTYTLVRKLTDKEVQDGKLNLELTTLESQYVITSANLTKATS